MNSAILGYSSGSAAGWSRWSQDHPLFILGGQAMAQDHPLFSKIQEIFSGDPWSGGSCVKRLLKIRSAVKLKNKCLLNKIK
jgi:hypothetical protein